jgi:hypothetical protein
MGGVAGRLGGLTRMTMMVGSVPDGDMAGDNEAATVPV